MLAQVLTNPFLIGTVGVAVLSFIGVLTDPQTKGIKDSEQAAEGIRSRKVEILRRGLRLAFLLSAVIDVVQVAAVLW